MYEFFEWMEGVGIYGSSPYLGPGTNLVHLLSMVVFAGALLVVDLRLMGRGLTGQPLPQVARDAQPWLVAGFLGLVITGIPALMSTATRQYVNWVFWLKMGLLLSGAIFTFTVRRNIVLADDTRAGSLKAISVGLASIVVWASVAAVARLIMLI